jgi:hypothetical protein
MTRHASRRLVAALAAVASLAVAGTAQADVFSRAVPPTVRAFDDCTVLVGPVLDPVNGLATYRKIGGAQVNCRSRHSFIEATVAQYYWNGARWVQAGAGGYGLVRSSYGWGSWITETQPLCGRGFWWMTGVTVRDERGAATLYSNPANDQGTGC